MPPGWTTPSMGWAELKVPGDFPPEGIAEANEVAGAAALPERDETAVPFLTIDPPGSMDLEQAMHIERAGKGYRVRYAIADVPVFVKPGGAIDVEAFKRGQTIYAPDRRTLLHPGQLSEDAASLLKEVGELRIVMERARGGASLPMPEQEVNVDEDGNYVLALRPQCPRRTGTPRSRC
jgi:exoribonuclease R